MFGLLNTPPFIEQKGWVGKGVVYPASYSVACMVKLTLQVGTYTTQVLTFPLELNRGEEEVGHFTTFYHFWHEGSLLPARATYVAGRTGHGTRKRALNSVGSPSLPFIHPPCITGCLSPMRGRKFTFNDSA